jgi:hypothetical protein
LEFAKLAKLFDRAVAANWLDRHRHGHLIELPEKGDLLYTADIHGTLRNFAAIVKSADLEHNPERHLILQEMVHQLEMGEDRSFRVLEKAAALKVKFPHRVHILMGNHDLAEIQGREIFKGGLCLNLLFENALEKAYGERKESVRAKYVEFIKTMPLAAVTQSGIFMAHSTPDRAEVDNFSMAFFRRAPDPRDFEKGGAAEKLVWGRDYAQDTADALAEKLGYEIFLVGHAPCSRGYEIPNSRHIILDCKDKYAAVILLDLARKYTHDELREMILFLHATGDPKATKEIGSRQ